MVVLVLENVLGLRVVRAKDRLAFIRYEGRSDVVTDLGALPLFQGKREWSRHLLLDGLISGLGRPQSR